MSMNCVRTFRMTASFAGDPAWVVEAVLLALAHHGIYDPGRPSPGSSKSGGSYSVARLEKSIHKPSGGMKWEEINPCTHGDTAVRLHSQQNANSILDPRDIHNISICTVHVWNNSKKRRALRHLIGALENLCVVAGGSQVSSSCCSHNPHLHASSIW